MICRNCGAQIADGSSFCTECGAPVQQESIQQQPAQPQYTPVEPQYTPYQPAVNNDPALNATPILITGILALALSWSGIGGLICAIICMSKVKKYQAAGGVISGKAKVGKILGTVGLIFSIIYIVVWAIYAIAFVIGVIGGALNGASSYLDF